MLEVSIHGDYALAPGGFEPSPQGGLVSEIPAQAQECQTAILARQVSKQGKASISASIVHKKYLEAAITFQGIDEGCCQGIDVGFLIVHRHHNGQLHPGFPLLMGQS